MGVSLAAWKAAVAAAAVVGAGAALLQEKAAGSLVKGQRDMSQSWSWLTATNTKSLAPGPAKGTSSGGGTIFSGIDGADQECAIDGGPIDHGVHFGILGWASGVVRMKGELHPTKNRS